MAARREPPKPKFEILNSHYCGLLLTAGASHFKIRNVLDMSEQMLLKHIDELGMTGVIRRDPVEAEVDAIVQDYNEAMHRVMDRRIDLQERGFGLHVRRFNNRTIEYRQHRP